MLLDYTRRTTNPTQASWYREKDVPFYMRSGLPLCADDVSQP